MPWKVAVGCTEFDALLGRVAASIGTDGRLDTGGDEANDGKLAARYFPFVHAASGGTLLRDATGRTVPKPSLGADPNLDVATWTKARH